MNAALKICSNGCSLILTDYVADTKELVVSKDEYSILFKT